MNEYQKTINLFLDNPKIAILCVVLTIIMTIPKLRDGILCLWEWVRPKKKKTGAASFKYTEEGETVTFDELVRSTILDIIRVNAHTHNIGVNAEYAWINKRYPKAQFMLQAFFVLKGKGKKKERKAFDFIAILCADGSTKQIYFEITSFFDGDTTSDSPPNEFARKKLREVYGM